MLSVWLLIWVRTLRPTFIVFLCISLLQFHYKSTLEAGAVDNVSVSLFSGQRLANFQMMIIRKRLKKM